MKRATVFNHKPIMVISDYPVQSEIDCGIPYSSASNLTLLSDLHKAGFPQTKIHSTYLSYSRPDKENFDWHQFFEREKNIDYANRHNYIKLPHQKDIYVEAGFYLIFQKLLNEIKEVKPKIILITGKWALFFLTGLVPYVKTQGNFKDAKALGALLKYRASICFLNECWLSDGMEDCLVYPILPATTKQRMPDKYPITKWDYGKLAEIFSDIEAGKTISDYRNRGLNIIFGSEFDLIDKFFLELEAKLDKEKTLVSVDIETRYNLTDCVGIAYKLNEAICIPFSTLSEPNYWSEEDHFKISQRIHKILSHPNCEIVGQNFSYDSQYFWRFSLRNYQAKHDTMVANHVFFNSFPKSLDFLASIYCKNYSYWKDMQNHSLEGMSK